MFDFRPDNGQIQLNSGNKKTTKHFNTNDEAF